MTMPLAARTSDAEFQKLALSRYAGNPGAITALALRIMVGRDAPCSPVDGEALLSEAARQGDAEAWRHLAVLAAAGVGRAQSWPDAFDALNRAADLGSADAVQQRQLLTDAGVHGVADLERWLSAGECRTLRDTPRCVAHAGFLTPALCSYLIERSKPRLIQAQVFDAHLGTLKVDAMRTNTGAAYSLIDTDLVIQLIRARIAHATAVAFEALEPTEVLHYSIGEQYKLHVDFFHPSRPNYAKEMRIRGQRTKTCLVYLNNDYEGGETGFPKLGIQFRGAVGEALVFDNVDATGAGDVNTLHAGQPVTRGEKWLLSQWIRNKPQPVV
jgi:hypothetical protein